LERNMDGTCSAVDCLCNNLETCYTTIEQVHNAELNRDMNGSCWPYAGACGSSQAGSFINPPSSNLCTPGCSPTTVQTNGTHYDWTCESDISQEVVGTCYANKTIICNDGDELCNGVCVAQGTCNTATSTLVQYFKMAPHIVATSTDFCTASWKADLPIDDSGALCTFNGSTVGASSTSQVHPGTYTLTCLTSNQQTQTLQQNCTLNPDVKER
jgi:hypothetical protein